MLASRPQWWGQPGNISQHPRLLSSPLSARRAIFRSTPVRRGGELPTWPTWPANTVVYEKNINTHPISWNQTNHPGHLCVCSIHQIWTLHSTRSALIHINNSLYKPNPFGIWSMVLQPIHIININHATFGKRMKQDRSNPFGSYPLFISHPHQAATPKATPG